MLTPETADKIGALIDAAIEERKACLAVGVPSIFTREDWELVHLLWPHLDDIRELLRNTNGVAAIHHPGTSCRLQNPAGACGCAWGACVKNAPLPPLPVESYDTGNGTLGEKVVPREPTPEMLTAARSHRPHPNVKKSDHWDTANAAVWRRMWDACGVNGKGGISE